MKGGRREPSWRAGLIWGLTSDRTERRMRIVAELWAPRGHGRGEPCRNWEFQQQVVCGAIAQGVRTALASFPPGEREDDAGGGAAVAELFVGDPSAEVLVVASDQRQAMITLGILPVTKSSIADWGLVQRSRGCRKPTAVRSEGRQTVYGLTRICRIGQDEREEKRVPIPCR